MSYHWKAKKSQASHTDDWLMTYADMITLLLCFFVIFLIISVSKKNTPQQTVVQPVIEQVAERQAHIALPLPMPSLPQQANTQPALVQPPVQHQINTTDAAQGNLPFHENDQSDDDDAPNGAPIVTAPIAATADVQAPAPDVPEVLPQTPIPASLVEIADNLKAQGPANFDQKSDRIKTFEVNSAAFFDSGSATLSRAGMAILREVAVNLKSDQFKDYRITVEGHTDDTPIRTSQFPSNWELSTGRASAVVHYLLEQGLPAERLRAAGYADTFPKLPNRNAAGNAIPANQALNRRVVIKLEKIEKD